jgi:hypothetical protein
MSAPANILKTKEGQWLAVGLVAAVVVYVLAKRTLKAAGGVLSGNNALTAGTPYQGTGLAGTLGAGANVVSGGALQSLGEWLGGKAADLHDYFTGSDPTASTPADVTGGATSAANRDQVVTPNYITDLGSVLDATQGGE